MTENELIDRIARAMHPRVYEKQPAWALPGILRVVDENQLWACEKARAALRAIREAGCEVVPKEAPNAWLVEMVGDRQFLGDGAAKMWRQAYAAMLSASPLKGET